MIPSASGIDRDACVILDSAVRPNQLVQAISVLFDFKYHFRVEEKEGSNDTVYEESDLLVSRSGRYSIHLCVATNQCPWLLAETLFGFSA